MNLEMLETSEGPSVRNTERNYEVILGGCVVTRKFDKVIRVQLGRIYNPLDGTVCPVIGSFSEQGLESLLQDLRTAPMPFSPPTQAEMNADTSYMWWVRYLDGDTDQQFPLNNVERNWGVVQCRTGDLEQLWIVPIAKVGELPGYAFLGRGGFAKCEFPGAPLEMLPILPPPAGMPFHWHYYRKVKMLFLLGQDGRTGADKARIRQIIGWRVEREDEDDLICEIAIEDDGRYEVWRQYPSDDPYWQTIESHQSKQIVASAGVFIVDPIETP